MCARPRNVRARTSTSTHRIRISLDRMPPLRIQPSQGVYGSNNLDRCAHLTPIRPFGTDDRDACTETAIQLDQLWSGRCYRTLEGALASYQPAAREQTGQHEVTAFCTMPRGYDNAAPLQCIARRIDLDTEVALRRQVATRDGEDKAKATNNRVRVATHDVHGVVVVFIVFEAIGEVGRSCPPHLDDALVTHAVHGLDIDRRPRDIEGERCNCAEDSSGECIEMFPVDRCAVSADYGTRGRLRQHRQSRTRAARVRYAPDYGA